MHIYTTYSLSVLSLKARLINSITADYTFIPIGIIHIKFLNLRGPLNTQTIISIFTKNRQGPHLVHPASVSENMNLFSFISRHLQIGGIINVKPGEI